MPRPTSRPRPLRPPDGPDAIDELTSTDEPAFTSRLELTFDEPIAPPLASAGVLRSARRLLRRKDRQESRQFLAEGRQAVGEALQTTYVRRVLVSDAAVETHQDLLTVAARAGVVCNAITADNFAALADTVTPQGIMAVCDAVDVALGDALTHSTRLIVFCDQVRDPGNLGTVIRCADAFGADAVLVSADSVDLYNSKTVRASTGSVFHLPISVGVALADAVALARRAGLATYGADGGGDCTVDDLATSGELAKPVLWVFGNEAWGLPDDHTALLDRLVALPMYGRAESLNLSTAAAVVLYATATSQH